MKIFTYLRSLFLASAVLAFWTNAYASTVNVESPVLASSDADDDKVFCDLPYSQSFDNENNDYPGDTYVPTGWLSVGDMPFVTNSFDNVPAKDGTYYLMALESSAARNDRCYTPFFKLKKGTKYSISFYVYAPGNAQTNNKTDFELTVGTEQDAEFHSRILTKLTECEFSRWQKVAVDYTPDEDNDYCFSFHVTSKAAYAGWFGIDLFNITYPEAVPMPKAAFVPVGCYSLMDSKLVCFSNSKIKMSNLSTDATSYLWEAEGAIPSSSTEKEPEFSFPKSGSYKIKLTAKNQRGSNSNTFTSLVSVYGNTSDLPLMTMDPNGDTMTTRDNLDAYDTNPYADFVAGVNHYYSHFAERFDVPEGREYEIYSLSFYLYYYNLGIRYFKEECNKPFSIVFYGEKDGRPDLNKVYGRIDKTMQEAWGTLNLGTWEQRGFEFKDKPVVADGPFYVAFEFPENLWLDETVSGATRTCVGFCGIKHRSKVSSLYVQPFKVPETSEYVVDGNYCPVEKVDSQYKGYGLYLTTWCNVKNDSGTSSIAIANDGSVVSAVRLSGDVLQVSGTKAGEKVLVYNVSGSVVGSVIADGEGCELSLSGIPAGIYVVKTEKGTMKFFKK